jgi:phosphoribosylanthranilate isomerase
MVIKVCGITRREDAEVAAEAGATAIGFIFYPKSPRYVTPDHAAELGRDLNVWKVGVFVDESPVAVEAVMRAANLDIVQLYGGELPPAARIWRAFRVWSTHSMRATPALVPAQGDTSENIEAVLLDGPANGVSFDWQQARGAATKIIVAGGLDASNVAEAIRVAQPWGVDASSRLEVSPGVKDHDKVRQFVKAAQVAT